MVPKNLRPLVPYLKRHRTGLLWGGLCVLCKNGIWILFPQVLHRAVNDLHSGVTRQKLLTYALLVIVIAADQGHLPIPDALGGHRHLPRYRIRSAQRPVQAPGTPLLLLLPAQPHRRHHGPRHQRSERGPDAARPGHHVLRQHHRLHRRSAGLHARHQPQADPLCLSPAAHRQHRHPVFRTPHSRALRTHSGHVLRHLGPRPGKLLRRPSHPRLCAGTSRDRVVRERQPGIHPPQPGTGPPDGNALAHPRTHARHRRRHRALARWSRGDRRSKRGHLVSYLGTRTTSVAFRFDGRRSVSWPSTPT